MENEHCHPGPRFPPAEVPSPSSPFSRTGPHTRTRADIRRRAPARARGMLHVVPRTRTHKHFIAARARPTHPLFAWGQRLHEGPGCAKKRAADLEGCATPQIPPLPRAVTLVASSECSGRAKKRAASVDASGGTARPVANVTLGGGRGDFRTGKSRGSFFRTPRF